ncbi:MAG: hypothetical protein PHR74_04640 [Candidatus Omnitrophica bacterium]|jgi:hypothetical protein|nr:hypothetical protein [Candidatus Omnitrophota bacterium]
MRRSLKKAVPVLLLVCMCMSMTGCETLKKKFVKKHPQKKVTPVMYPQDYKGVYTNDVLYNNHFNYWRTWTEDLIDCLKTKGSSKREVLAATRAVEDLQRMQDLLNSPKKEDLEKYVKFYESVRKKVELGQPTDVQASRLVGDLDSRRRVIMRLFETKTVKPFIISEEESIKPLNTIEQTLPGK